MHKNLLIMLILGAMLAGCGAEVPSQPQTDPTQLTVPSETEAVEVGTIAYQDYLALPVEEQQKYYESFQSPEAFFQWMDAAQEAYEAATTPTETQPDEPSYEEGGVEEWD